MNAKDIIYASLIGIMASVGFVSAEGASIVYTHNINISDLSISDMKAPNGTIFSRISGYDMFGTGEDGTPEIPYKVIRFLVPDKAYDFSVAVEDCSDTESIILEHPVFPNQKPVPINDYSDDLFTYSDTCAYRNFSSFFHAEVIEDFHLEGKYHIVAVGLGLFEYNGNPIKLKLCKSMRVRLDYKENSILRQNKTLSFSHGFINISDIVVNTDLWPEDRKGSYVLNSGEAISQTLLPRYYIISEKSLLPALQDLATWKIQKGYCVVTTAIEDIYADSRYKVGTNGIVDEAASLRKYLQDEYSEHGTFFCILVGDHRTKMPIRKVYFDEYRLSSEDINGDKYVPTDNYFSDLSEEGWTLRYDSKGLYIADVSTSYHPNIYIGRLLCSKPEEINNYLSKLILYEMHPGRGNYDYLDHTSLSVMYDGRNTYSSLLSEMEKTFGSVECLLDCKISDINSKGYPSGNLIIQNLNKNGFCSWTGHGEPSTVACSGMLYDERNPSATGSDKWEYVKALTPYTYDSNPQKRQTNIVHLCYDNGIDQLTNYDSPSLVYATSCNTCPFDIYKSGDVTYDLPHTVGSSYTVGGLYGGVGYLGNTRNGYIGPSENLEVSFLNKIKSNPKVGVAESLSKIVYNGTNSIYYQHVRHTNNLIGDPEFEMWRCKPLATKIDISWDEKDISINGDDIVGSTIVINDGESKVRRLDVTSESNGGSCSGMGKMEAVGIYKSGYLPMVKLDCYNDELKECSKKFVVRSSKLGCKESKTVSIGSDADVDIRAVDSIEGGLGLEITEKGRLTLRCDKEVLMNGSEIRSGGVLNITGEKVVLSNGFSVKPGGKLLINKP